MTTKENIRNQLKHKWKPPKNMKAKEKPKKTTMTSKEQHMNIIENQRKIYEQTKEKPMRTTEKSMKNKEGTMKNNRKPRAILPAFSVTFGPFAPVVSSFSSLMGKGIRDNFERNRKPVLRRLGDWVFTKPCKYAVKCNFRCICGSNRVIFLVAVFGVPLWRKTRCTEKT